MLESKSAQQRHEDDNAMYILGLTIASLDYLKHRKHGSKRCKAKRRKGEELPEQEVEQRCREVKLHQV